MKSIKLLAGFIISQALTNNIFAQTGTDYLNAYKISNCTIAFDVEGEGQPFNVKWGMDTAWDWDFNVNRGVAHIGKGNFETGRISFQPNDLVKDNGDGTYTLSTRQQNALRNRCNLIKLTGTKYVNINCDHEALFKNDDFTGRTNYQGKPIEWYKLIKASVQFAQKQGLIVTSVSPFNEPDYVWQQATNEAQAMVDFLAIAKLIKADPFFDNIRISGGNTLNCDRALPWYNYLKNYIDEGNTHQLAGSFDNYANFFSTVVKDGKLGTADELHNVGEAIVGAQYGMTSGIWWGFDGRARGQFCKDSNQGVRLGYGESRDTWTTGAVYRNDLDNEVHAYLGSSERQANSATYSFVSKNKDVYFNGFGPTREYSILIPGGNGYQKGQINAEKLIDITYGEDVPQAYVDGTYQVMNYYSTGLLNTSSSNPAAGALVQTSSRKEGAINQQWVVKPENVDGDCSYWTFMINNENKRYLNLQNLNLNSGASAIVWSHDGKPLLEEQWFLKYAGNGYWYIISRLSNKALRCSSKSASSAVTLGECPKQTASLDTRKPYMWRFMPLDAQCNTNIPVWSNSRIETEGYSSSIRVKWNQLADETVTYNILRSPSGQNKFNTIARSVSGDTFLDNTINNGEYDYKVVPVAYNGTRGAASRISTCKTLDKETLIAQYQFEDNTEDNSENKISAAFYGTEKYSESTFHKSGSKGLNLYSQNSYLKVSHSLANMDNMTIACWVRWGGGDNWQRIFDFGNGTNEYMFLTPSNGKEMRFVMKNGGDEQILSTTSLRANTWKHIAITFKKNDSTDNATEDVTLYIDGEKVGSKEFTITPSSISPSLCFIGRSQFTADKLFKGYIDDLRFYNYPLSEEKVKEVMTDVDEKSKDLEETTSIGSVAEEYNSTITGIFTISGTKVIAPQKGINIIRYSNGRTSKIINK